MKLLRLISVISLFGLLGILATHSLDSINQDIGRHLKTGQIIWQTKSVPKTNLFSFTEPDQPFINHHWLSEVAFFLASGAIGLKGLIVFKVIIFLVALGLTLASVRPPSRLWALLTAALAGILVLIERTDVRPEIFSYLFLSYFLLAIFRAKYQKNYRYLYALPLIQIFWTNMHIYFVVGPILLFLFLIDRKVYREARANFNKLLMIFLLTTAVTLLNPNFIEGALIPFTILKEYGYTIVENQTIFFLKDYGLSRERISLFEASLVVLGVSFVIAFKNGRRRVLFELVCAIIFSALAIRMIRNFALYGFAFIPIVALNLSTIKIQSLSKKKFLKLFLYLLYLAIPVSLIWFVTTTTYPAGTFKHFGLAIPEGAAKGVNFIKENKIQGPMFNNFDVGSFLIWKIYPDQLVFVDGRPEAYGAEFFEKIYKPMQESPALWKKYSEQYQVNYVFFDHHDITPWARTFFKNIARDPDWPLVYRDNSVVIFLKRTPKNQELINRFLKGSQPSL